MVIHGNTNPAATMSQTTGFWGLEFTTDLPYFSPDRSSR
jgi:hypothetical protein